MTQHWWIASVVAVVFLAQGSLQHEGHDHGRHHGGGIVVNPGIGSTGLNDPLSGVDPGFNAGSQGGAVFGGSEFGGQGRIGSFDNYIDGNNGFINDRGGLIDPYTGRETGFIQGGGDGFISGGDGFVNSGGFTNSGAGFVSGNGGFDDRSRYDGSFIDDVNRFNGGRDFGSGSFNDGGRFVDFGMNGPYDNNLPFDGGVNDGFIGSGFNARGIDDGLNGGFISRGGSNRMVTGFGGRRDDFISGGDGFLNNGGFVDTSGGPSGGLGFTDRDRGFDGQKLRGFSPAEPFSDIIGGAAIGGDPLIKPRPASIGAVGSVDRVMGVKSGAAAHHSKLTTIVRPIVRPVIRPVVRPVIQRIVRPIIQRPVIRRVVRPIVRPVINRVVRPNIRRPIINRMARPIISRARQPDFGSGGLGSPNRGQGGIGSGRPAYKPSYKRTKYY